MDVSVVRSAVERHLGQSREASPGVSKQTRQGQEIEKPMTQPDDPRAALCESCHERPIREPGRTLCAECVERLARELYQGEIVITESTDD